MTKEFEIMLRLFGDFSLGRKSDTSDITPESIPVIIKLAHTQGIWTCIYPQLCDSFDMSKYKMSFLALMSCSVRQNEFTMKILEEAGKIGLEYCLLKGQFAASLYANPEYRISSDVDILINPKDEKKFADYLKSKGYEVESRKKNDHHLKARHPIGGLLETHISLYSHITDKIVMGGRDMYGEPYMKVDIGSKEIYTLGINDNLNYLTAHYIKHLVTGQSGVRQMMDLLLYIIKYEKEIDFEKYDKLLESLKYDKLIKTVKSIGAKYFGMDFELCNDVDMDILLTDCEKCGLFAQAAKGDVTFYSQYCAKRKEVSTLKLKLMFLFKNETTVFNRIFPSQQSLVALGYGYAKNKALVPVAWAHKLIDYAFRKTKSINKTDNNQLSERENMMKAMNMLDS